MPEGHQTIFADSDAHIWQDTAHHVWVKEIIEEVLRRLSLVFELLPDRFSSAILKLRFSAMALIYRFSTSVLKLSYEAKALIDRFLTRVMK